MDGILTPEELEHALVYYNKTKVEGHIAALEAQVAVLAGALQEEIASHDDIALNGINLDPIMKSWLGISAAIMRDVLANLPAAATNLLARLEAGDWLADLLTEYMDDPDVTAQPILYRALEAYRKAKEGADGR